MLAQLCGATAGKLGCSPEEMGDLIRYLLEECPHLDFHGLMTVGKFGHSPKLKPNPDFAVSIHCDRFSPSIPVFMCDLCRH